MVIHHCFHLTVIADYFGEDLCESLFRNSIRDASAAFQRESSVFRKTNFKMVVHTSMTEQTCCSWMLIHHRSVTFSNIYASPVYGSWIHFRGSIVPSTGSNTFIEVSFMVYHYLMNLIFFKGLYDQALVPVYCMQRDQSSTILLDNNKWMNIWLKA
ncbi:hypothetical protein AB4K20DRAFT_1871075 [Rhizopus microsporus]|uniref:Uncharacterized protein n=1 Tax=Rhizopus microsporus TaxID=58291 RepID=A0A1X0RXR1_RHIZD|nr:hypothetical protein BCV71DRAFT_270965 [Rhizopus microsporus]